MHAPCCVLALAVEHGGAQLAVRNVEVMLDVMTLLRREVRLSKVGLDELRESFNMLTGVDNDQLLTQFKLE